MSVDLGCGNGWLGPSLKKHTDYLIGVDYRQEFLQVALTKGYDEAVCMDFREYRLPSIADSVFLFDSLEHIPKECGNLLLDRIGIERFVMLTTPSRFRSADPETDHHLSLWTVNELAELGFNVYLLPEGGRITKISGDQFILALREGE
jgi:SAM-dependent methyltransferase